RWREEAAREGRASAGWGQTLEAASDARGEGLLFSPGVTPDAWPGPPRGRAAAGGGAGPPRRAPAGAPADRPRPARPPPPPRRARGGRERGAGGGGAGTAGAGSGGGDRGVAPLLGRLGAVLVRGAKLGRLRQLRRAVDRRQLGKIVARDGAVLLEAPRSHEDAP